jgi:predicted metal-dependent phosphotriesterase family hydrolase
MTTIIAITPKEAELLEAANITKAEFAGVPTRKHTRVLKRLIDEADVVLAVYVDPAAMRLGTSIIKGEGQLELIRITGASVEMKMRVIHVKERAEAEAMRRVFGDGARLQ